MQIAERSVGNVKVLDSTAYTTVTKSGGSMKLVNLTKRLRIF